MGKAIKQEEVKTQEESKVQEEQKEEKKEDGLQEQEKEKIEPEKEEEVKTQEEVKKEKIFVIHTPNKSYTGLNCAVEFKNGIGRTKNEIIAEHFIAKGYEVEEV